MRRLLPPALLVAAALAAAPAAQAGRTQESILQDDRVLTFEGAARQSAALGTMASLGVDTVHTVVNWRRLAPNPESRTPPPGFDGASPASYAAADWDVFDSLVRGARERGMDVLMSPAGPVPDWASRCPDNVNTACRPDPRLYAAFVAALGRRYSGTYADESDGRPLPRVGRWSIWNEPNLPAWIHPQVERVRGRAVRTAPRIYRELAYAATGALGDTGHGRDQVLLGETAPIGTGSRSTAPTDFYLRLFCLDERGRPLRGRAARDEGCARLRRLRVTGVAHHPYARGAGPPLSRRQRRGAVTIATLGRLERVLALGRRSRVLRRRVPIHLTEFGVTTDPPDRKFGVPLDRQAELLNASDYLAYRRPSVRSVAQFELEDDTGLETLTFQTGLAFGDGRPKPSLAAYRVPLHLTRRGRRLEVWGQARPARDRARERIEIQRKRSRDADFRTVATAAISRKGFVVRRLPAQRALWRLRWQPAGGGGALFSRLAGSGGAVPPPTPVPPPAARTHALTVEFQREAGALPGIGGGRVLIVPPGRECRATCAETFAEGTVVTLTAQPDEGSRFDGFEGEGCSGTAPCVVTMTQARTVRARFTYTGGLPLP